MAKGKKYRDAARRYDREMFHGPREALELVKSLATKNFDESIDLVVRLGVDPRKADQMVRGTVSLPSGSGKNVRVAVFAEGEQAEAARAAGADFVGGEELAAEIQGGMMDFDLTIATPDMMPTVGKLGRVLGPWIQETVPTFRIWKKIISTVVMIITDFYSYYLGYCSSAK